MKNKLTDLNNYLFEQLERIQDDTLTDEQFEREVKRSKAVSDIATQIVKNSEVALKACQFAAEYGVAEIKKDALIGMIGDEIYE